MKNLHRTLCFFWMIFLLSFLGVSAQGALNPGDMNGDGKVDEQDLITLRRYLGGENVTLKISGDLNCDGKLNAQDLAQMRRYLNGDNVELSACAVTTESIVVMPERYTMKVGGAVQLTATVTPESASGNGITWTSSNGSVATVDTKGLVIAKAEGSAVITAATPDGKTDTCQVTVSGSILGDFTFTPLAEPGTCRVSEFKGDWANPLNIPATGPDGCIVTEIGRMGRTVACPDNCPDCVCTDNLFSNVFIPSTVKIIRENAFEFRRNSHTRSHLRQDELIIPEGVEIIEANAFPTLTCKKIVLPDSLTTLGTHAFGYFVHDLQEINYPVNLRYIIPESKNPNQLDTPFPEQILHEDESGLYSRDYFLTMKIPEGVASIPPHMFEHAAIGSISFPESLKFIGETAFSWSSLKGSVVLPSNIEIIEDFAFGYCLDVTDVYVPASLNVDNVNEDYYPFGLGTSPIIHAVENSPFWNLIAERYPNWIETGRVVPWDGIDPTEPDEPEEPVYVNVSGIVTAIDGTTPIEYVFVKAVNANDDADIHIVTTNLSGQWNMNLTEGESYNITYSNFDYTVSGAVKSFVAANGISLSAIAVLNGEIDSNITFTMMQDGVLIDNEGILVGTAVDFSVTVPDKTDMFRLVVDGVAYENHSLNDRNFSRIFSSAGTGIRTIQFQIHSNNEWTNFSEPKTLKITKISDTPLDIPVIHKVSNHEKNTSLSIIWDPVKNAQFYTVYVYSAGIQRWPVPGTDPERISVCSYEIPESVFKLSGDYSIQVNTIGEGYESSTGYMDLTVKETYYASDFYLIAYEANNEHIYRQYAWEVTGTKLKFSLKSDLTSGKIILKDNGEKICDFTPVGGNVFETEEISLGIPNTKHSFTVHCVNSEGVETPMLHKNTKKALTIPVYSMRINSKNGNIVYAKNEMVTYRPDSQNPVNTESGIKIPKNSLMQISNGVYTINNVKFMLIKYNFDEYFVIADPVSDDNMNELFYYDPGSVPLITNISIQSDISLPEHPDSTYVSYSPNVRLTVSTIVNVSKIQARIQYIPAERYKENAKPTDYETNMLSKDTGTGNFVMEGHFTENGIYFIKLEAALLNDPENYYRSTEMLLPLVVVDPVNKQSAPLTRTDNYYLKSLPDFSYYGTGTTGVVDRFKKMTLLGNAGNDIWYVSFKNDYGTVEYGFIENEYVNSSYDEATIRGISFTSQDEMVEHVSNWAPGEQAFVSLIEEMGGTAFPIRNVTREGIEQILNGISIIDDNDITYIYIQAHGGCDDRNENGIPCEKDEYLFALDSYGKKYSKTLKDSAMYYDELADLLQLIPGQVIIILNPCHSGAAIPVFEEKLDKSRFSAITGSREDEVTWSFLPDQRLEFLYFTHKEEGTGGDMLMKILYGNVFYNQCSINNMTKKELQLYSDHMTAEITSYIGDRWGILKLPLIIRTIETHPQLFGNDDTIMLYAKK